MFHRAVVLAAFAFCLAAGCNDSDVKKPFTTSSASPAVELPPGVKLQDQKDAAKPTKPGKTEPN